MKTISLLIFAGVGMSLAGCGSLLVDSTSVTVSYTDRVPLDVQYNE